MRTRTKNLLMFGGVTAVVVGLGVWAEARRETPRVVDVLPKGTTVVVELDLAALRASGLATLRLPGALDDVTKGCRDGGPLAAVDRLALALPGASLEGDLAIVALGSRVRAAAFVDCARQVIGARGGTAKTSQRDGFTFVQEGEGLHGVLAVRDGGPVVLGRGAWFDAVLAAAQGTAPSLHGDPVHDLERGKRAGALAIATWSIGDDDRVGLRKQLPEPARAVADVRAIVIDARDDGAGGVSLLVDALCDAGACDGVARWAEGAKSAFAREPMIGALGLGEVVQGARVGAQSDRVRASFALPAPALSSAISGGAGGKKLP
jgi:hypothetical protein